MRIYILFIVFIFSVKCPAQRELEGFLKNKVSDAKDKAKQKALEKAKQNLDKQSKEYDESNFNYAISFLDNSGKFEADEKGNAFSSAISNLATYTANEEKTIEERAYTNLKNGEMLMASNKHHLAEQSFKLAKLLYEQDNKTNTTNYAQTISNLGLLYHTRGLFIKAKPLHEQALSLRKNLDNKGMQIVSINNIAVLKKETGLYVEAEKELKEALVLATEQKDKLAQGLIHNNLAMVYLDMNKLKDSENQMHSALTEASTILAPTSSNYIKLQINLANIYRFQKKLTSAEEIYIQAIAVKEKKLGTHPDLAHLKKGLAQIYMQMGKTNEAEKLLISAYDIYKKKLGDNNPATLSAQQELANYYRFTGSADKALPLNIDVVEQKKIIYGIEHPNYIQALEDLSLTLWENRKIAEAGQNFKVVINSTLKYINTFFQSLNESEKTEYWQLSNIRLQRYYNFIVENKHAEPALIEAFYNTLINTKGFLLNNSAKIRATIFASSDESLKETYNQWLSTKENLNQAFQLSKEELIQDKINLDSLIRREDELERELSKKSALFKESTSEEKVTFENIQKQLKANEAAIEIIELDEYKNGFTGKQNYVALVLKSTSIEMVALGMGAEIKSAISSFREKVIDLKPENEAFSIVWKDLDEKLKGITKMYVSLDGAYHQLSIGGLKDVSGKYLADKYALQIIGNSKDILEIKKNELAKTKPKTAFLVGNPFYGKNEIIDQLPGTELEVKKIQKLLTVQKVKATALFGDKATEQKVKEISSPSILHIATHGYFLEDLSEMESTKVLGVDLAAAKENPLLRCGLLLVNCDNVFDENFHAAPDSENGVLTAYEAMSLNLDKTDLVVLSACQTGLGSVKQGEGVYGLQRAFLIAGAKSIIMSLWNVSDEATVQLMTLFYTNYAKSGDKNLAFTNAIKQLKVKYKEPYYWAPFVMLSR